MANADILVLMTDQHRADWIGAFGGSWVRTPALDGLANEGVVFTNCTTSSPLCMPARVSFLTGMYPHNFGMWDNLGRLHDVDDTILHPLRAAGYRTCHVGKSHLHPHGNGRDVREAEPYMHALGWDDVLECTGPLSTQTTKSMLTDWMEAEGLYQTFLDDYRRRAQHASGPDLWPSPLPDGKHMDDFIADTAVNYISDSDTSQPLYLFVGIGGPHNPFDPTARFDTYRPEDMPPPLPADPAPEWLDGPALAYHDQMTRHNREVTPDEWARMRSLYSGKVEHVDYLLGRVLDAWYRRRGRDTWVIFWTDHGEMLGDKRRTAKGVYYRASVRVPVILRPPGGLSCPTRQTCPTGLTDLSATVLDAAGCRPGANVFGQSLLPAPQDANSVGHPVVFSELHHHTMVSDGRWKMLVDDGNQVLLLFDTQEDPDETLNLAGRCDTTEVVERLRGQLLEWLLRTAYRQHRDVNG